MNEDYKNSRLKGDAMAPGMIVDARRTIGEEKNTNQLAS